MSATIWLEHDAVSEIENFTGSEVIITPSFVFFWKPPGIYGQWTPSSFAVDGVDYSCAEQFMMAEKARLFGDVEMEKKILATHDPKTQKALGRKVRGFSPVLWEQNRLDIVTRGNLAKFSQNPEMGHALLKTGDRELVEASPLDKIWGVGLRADNPAIADRSKWRGLNLLGVALMKVREALRSS